MRIRPTELAPALALASVVTLAACGSAADADAEDVSVGRAASALTCADYDPDVAAKLAAAGSKREGHRSEHLCYAQVKKSLAAGGIDVHGALAPYRYAASAYEFTRWADENPAQLAAAGLTKIDIGNDAPPKGAILVWGRGVCGYSKKHGHIEIVENDDGSRACSDFCGRVRHGCGKPTVFVPTPKPGAAASAACAGGTGDGRTAPRKDSCVGKSAGWYCSELVTYSAYECSAAGTIDYGFQCAQTALCQVADARGAATLGADGLPTCGGAP